MKMSDVHEQAPLSYRIAFLIRMTVNPFFAAMQRRTPRLFRAYGRFASSLHRFGFRYDKCRSTTPDGAKVPTAFEILKQAMQLRFALGSWASTLARKIYGDARTLNQEREAAKKFADRPWAKGLSRDQILAEAERRAKRAVSDPGVSALMQWFIAQDENREDLESIEEWLLSLTPEQIQGNLDRRGLRVGEVALRDPIVDDDLLAQCMNEPWSKGLSREQILEELDRRDLRGEVGTIIRRGRDFRGFEIKRRVE